MFTKCNFTVALFSKETQFGQQNSTENISLFERLFRKWMNDSSNALQQFRHWSKDQRMNTRAETGYKTSGKHFIAEVSSPACTDACIELFNELVWRDRETYVLLTIDVFLLKTYCVDCERK